MKAKFLLRTHFFIGCLSVFRYIWGLLTPSCMSFGENQAHQNVLLTLNIYVRIQLSWKWQLFPAKFSKRSIFLLLKKNHSPFVAFSFLRMTLAHLFPSLPWTSCVKTDDGFQIHYSSLKTSSSKPWRRSQRTPREDSMNNLSVG